MKHDYDACKLTQEELKELYINNISSLLLQCTDISLLDLIEKLLKKSI
jgi:hypothetical protein